ncbi:MAG: peptidoglycan-binding protein [Myxococcaceae bacterium]|nr:peptidoglycan-binding protein [Myxococcaceae bacterium]
MGGADDLNPASGLGFSGESCFDAGGKVDPASMLAMQGPMSRAQRSGEVEASSALSALSGQSGFDAGPAQAARSSDAAARQAAGAEAPAARAGSGASENLARGSRGTDVRQLQEQLKRAGFDPGPLDGKFGPLTEAAVRRFQQARGLDTDGIAGPITKGALGQARQPVTGEQAAPGGRARGAGGPQGATQPGGAQRAQGAGDAPAPRGSGRTQEFLRQALSQNGNRYVFGAEASPNNANPRALDCSELVEWAAARAGVRFPDGSANQIAAARPMSVEQALRTPGALLYRPGHIAISLGDGRTIEARNSRAGVGIFNANGRGWTRAGTIPGMQ